MLSDDEKQRIAAEEAFRAELRHKFGDPPKSKLWIFLNSAFGLWLLGSVTVAVITWKYQTMQTERREAFERRESRQKLQDEISTRFQVAEYYVRAAQAAAAHRNEAYSLPTVELARLILNEANGNESVVYAEFKGVPANALFARLVSLYPSPPYYQISKSQHDWMYLEPKLHLRGYDASYAELSSEELQKRLLRISEGIGQAVLRGEPKE